MPARNRKGRFTKGGGGKTRTRTVTKTKYRTRKAPRHHRRGRRGHHHGAASLGKIAIAAAGLAYLTGAKGPKSVSESVAKLPGAKTFGNAATLGLALLAVDRFVKKNAWLRAAGIAGLVLGATQVGNQGADFKWLGDGSDVGDEFTGDIEGEDIGDEDIGDED